MNQERLARLRAELVAIDKWEENYRRRTMRHINDKVAYEASQLRRREILREIENPVCHSDHCGAA